MPNDSSGTDSNDLWSTVRSWAPGLRNGTSLLTRSNPDRSTSDIDRTRRSVLRDAGTAGALALGSGLVPFTTRVSGEPDTRFVAGATCHDPSPPETCDEVYEAIAQEILRLRDLVNQCNRAREAAIARNTHLSEQTQERWWRDYEAGFPNGIWGGQCRAGLVECGFYPVPDCSGLEADLRNMEARLNLPCEDIEPTQEEIDRSINEQLRALEDLLDQLNAKRRHIQRGISYAQYMIALLGILSRAHPAFLAGVAAWADALYKLNLWLNYVDELITKVQNRIRDLGRCRAGVASVAPMTAAASSSRFQSTASESWSEFSQRSVDTEDYEIGPVLVQAEPLDIDIKAIDYSYEEVSKFEPWPLRFDSPENEVEATAQAVTEVGLYLGFAQADLTVSMRRYTLVNDLRTQFQSMYYVPSDLVQSLAETEVAQMGAIAHNASASADLVDELIQLQSDVNALSEELEGDTIELSPEETRQQFQQWWDDQRNRDEVFVRFMPSQKGWDEFQTDVTQVLGDVSFEMPDQEVLFDEQWRDDLRSLSDSYESLAETVRQYRSIVADIWLPPTRWTG